MPEMIIPTDDQCLQLLRIHNTLPNVLAHSFRVRQVALDIVNNLKSGNHINRNLISAAALLHDIDKSRAIRSGERQHDTSGGKLLREMGMNEIAYIVESHVVFENYNPEGPVDEREIVFYSDKRVMHDRVVTIPQRVENLLIRYGKTEDIRKHILMNHDFMLKLEEKLQNHTTFDIRTNLT